MDRQLVRHFTFLIVAITLVAWTLSFAFATHHLPLGAFAGLFGLSMAVLFMVLLLLLRQARRKAQASDALLSSADAFEKRLQRLHQAIRIFRLTMIAIAISQIFQQLTDWNASLAVHIFGAAFTLTLMTLIYIFMCRAKAQLEGLGEVR